MSHINLPRAMIVAVRDDLRSKKASKPTAEQAVAVRGQLTQVQFAELMGVTKRCVQHWEAGTRAFSANNLELAQLRVSRLAQSPESA